MSTPGNTHPPPPPGSAGGKILLLVLLVAVLLASTCCCGGFVGLLYWLRSTPAVRQVVAQIQGQTPPPAPNAPWINNWVVDSILTRAYTEALDLVAANKEVIALLGEPIETVEQSEEGQLFKRQNSGDLNPSFEALEFQIKGTKGEAAVTVMALPYAGPGQYRLTKLTVTVTDGTVIEIPLRQTTAPTEQETPDSGPEKDTKTPANG